MKMIKIAFGLFALILSGSAFAQYNDTTAVISAVVDDTSCEVLSGQVTLNRSTGVVSALHCRTIWGDAIVGTCHTSGNVAPTTQACSCTNVSTTATPDHQPNISTCPGTCDTAGSYVPTDSSGDSVLLAGRKVFGASTAGGSVAAFTLGDTGLCNDTNIVGVSLFP